MEYFYRVFMYFLKLENVDYLCIIKVGDSELAWPKRLSKYYCNKNELLSDIYTLNLV